MSSDRLVFSRTIQAPRAEAFRAFTRSLAVRDWLCDGAVIEARPGGRLFLWWNSGYHACGEFRSFEPDRGVTFTWRGSVEPGPMQVAVRLEDATGGGVEVTLAQSGFGDGEAWDRARAEASEGWEDGMNCLASVLETGQDLRYVRRPFLGIYLDEFTPETAARLGVPVGEGIRLSGVVEGRGAQKAGLQADDVVVAIGGRPTGNYESLTSTLNRLHAGDRVAVDFYRGAERRTVEMELSGRPVPAVPAEPRVLAQAVEEACAASFALLEEALAGVSDAEATFRPAPTEWNALEVLAHLVAEEREWQTQIGDLLCDDERWSERSVNTTVTPARIAAIVGAHPSLAGMMDALRRSQGEKVRMLSLLPPELVAHRGTYWRLGRDLMEQVQAPSHAAEHTAQIKAAIAAARGQ